MNRVDNDLLSEQQFAPGKAEVMEVHLAKANPLNKTMQK